MTLLHEVMDMIRNRPNDTRYSFAALAAGLVGAAGLMGGLFLAGIAPPLAALANSVT